MSPGFYYWPLMHQNVGYFWLKEEEKKCWSLGRKQILLKLFPLLYYMYASEKESYIAVSLSCHLQYRTTSCSSGVGLLPEDDLSSNSDTWCRFRS